MQQRIIELAAQSPCSVEYLADVLQQPKEAIAAELKKLERQGRLKANRKDNDMWYFAWVLGLGFAVLLAVLNAMWGEFEEERAQSLPKNRGNAS